MASITALRALLGASLGLGALDLVWLDLALAPRVVGRGEATAVVHADPPAQLGSAAAPARVTRTAVVPDEDRRSSAGGAAPPAPAPASAPPPAPRAASAPPSSTSTSSSSSSSGDAPAAPTDTASPQATTTRVYFASTSATLDDTARAALARLAATVPPGAVVVVEGHADHRGGERYNQALSRQRAVAVETYLVARGVARARIRVGYVGEAEALGDGELWRDRRVDVQITSQHTGGER